MARYENIPKDTLENSKIYCKYEDFNLAIASIEINDSNDPFEEHPRKVIMVEAISKTEDTADILLAVKEEYIKPSYSWPKLNIYLDLGGETFENGIIMEHKVDHNFSGYEVRFLFRFHHTDHLECDICIG